MVDDGGGGEAHHDAGVVGRVGDVVPRVAALHVVVLGIAVQERGPHVAGYDARAAFLSRHVLFRHWGWSVIRVRPQDRNLVSCESRNFGRFFRFRSRNRIRLS